MLLFPPLSLALVKRTKQQQKTNIRLQYEQMMRFVAPLLGDDDRKVIELFGKRQTDRRKDGQTFECINRQYFLWQGMTTKNSCCNCCCDL